MGNPPQDDGPAWLSMEPDLVWQADADAIKAQSREAKKEATALREKRHNCFVEKLVNNRAWARGLSKDEVDESNQRFRSWVDGSGAVDGPAAAESEGALAPVENEDVEMGEVEKTG
ncbi:Histone deacetylase interacting [Penicillium bovifimosum]|uniref:Histone deacetylase interacting n=1 Tax=Penicillium bovifimosum TaxID=126998 RepID=A0A9W9GNG7_9EURO|nr:Histone deacetylase interacting [Penicillium bovifimosum]KAJ5124878.1 Histone deacetylase interacting [Penicillium bovifimosum]